ncbi:RHS repeat-associated core domain-containing protein, partial [Streptomyces sp. NPDC086080]|uniref:RHS repeat-associated core domain-containing protein n=1 Tax=Streptomyces sp. NPDC086080 TaxID=3365748 RepID=UPI0037D351AA
NTAGRTGGPRTQDLTWDAEGHLTKIVEDGKTTEYVYDSDGNRMLAKNADGSTTAYLPGGNELQITATGAKTATRYYTHGGETVAVRTSTGGFSFLFGDHQGTALIAIAMGAVQTVTRRKQLPFGTSRSAAGSSSWPGDRGFVGGTTDPTGYTHLGAREYDPTLGRFVSVDPLLLTDDPTQHNPYTYGNNNPATYSDPTGEAIAECMRQEIACSGGLPKRKPKINSAVSGGNPGSPGNSGSYIPWTPGSKKRILANPSKGRYNTYGHQGRNSYGQTTHAAQKAYNDAYREERRLADIAYTKAQAERNKKEEGFWGGIKSKIGDAVDYAMSYKNTSGICLSAGGAFGFGGSATGCFIQTTRPDGKVDYGVSGTIEETVGVGGGLTLGFIRSNADDFDQLRGEAAGVGVEAGSGLLVSASHRGTFDTRNARGDIVHSVEVGFGPGAGVTASFGSGVTGITRLWTS